MKSIKKIFALCIVMITLAACNQGPSLQKYYVEHQETPFFSVVDIPTATLVSVDQLELTPKQKKAFESVEKLNFLLFRKTDENTTTFKEEHTEVKTILAQPKYKTLMKFGSKNQGLVLKYLGEEDAIDEVVFFGKDSKMGFGILRVVGKDIDPSAMLQLAQELNTSNFDESKLGEVFKYFKN